MFHPFSTPAFHVTCLISPCSMSFSCFPVLLDYRAASCPIQRCNKLNCPLTHYTWTGRGWRVSPLWFSVGFSRVDFFHSFLFLCTSILEHQCQHQEISVAAGNIKTQRILFCIWAQFCCLTSSQIFVNFQFHVLFMGTVAKHYLVGYYFRRSATV